MKSLDLQRLDARWDCEPRQSQRDQSADKSDAVQTLREVQRAVGVASAFGVRATSAPLSHAAFLSKRDRVMETSAIQDLVSDRHVPMQDAIRAGRRPALQPMGILHFSLKRIGDHLSGMATYQSPGEAAGKPPFRSE